ncbi:MAG: hypothetical protein ACUZ77_12590 [Candidatus Brocadiales bacterium]
MSKDLEIIKKIEKELGSELERVDKEDFRFGSYCTDDKNNIINLDLHNLKISDISALKDLQKLTYLSLRNNRLATLPG